MCLKITSQFLGIKSNISLVSEDIINMFSMAVRQAKEVLFIVWSTVEVYKFACRWVETNVRGELANLACTDILVEIEIDW